MSPESRASDCSSATSPSEAAQDGRFEDLLGEHAPGHVDLDRRPAPALFAHSSCAAEQPAEHRADAVDVAQQRNRPRFRHEAAGPGGVDRGGQLDRAAEPDLVVPTLDAHAPPRGCPQPSAKLSTALSAARLAWSAKLALPRGHALVSSVTVPTTFLANR